MRSFGTYAADSKPSRDPRGGPHKNRPSPLTMITSSADWPRALALRLPYGTSANAPASPRPRGQPGPLETLTGSSRSRGSASSCSPRSAYSSAHDALFLAVYAPIGDTVGFLLPGAMAPIRERYPGSGVFSADRGEGERHAQTMPVSS
jgi:hypothetical protein